MYQGGTMPKTSTVLSLIIWAAVGLGQETPKSNQPELSGTWVLDMDRSDFGGPKSGLAYDSLTLIIEHREPEIKITRVMVKKRKETTEAPIYYTDQRGEVNKSLDRYPIKSKTLWKDNKLITTGIKTIPISGDVIQINSVDTWELTDGGSILVQKTISRMEGSTGRTVILDGGKNSTTQKIYRKAN